MSSLQERLDRIKAGFAKQAPAEAIAVMEKALDDLSASGILSRIPKVGDVLPAFELPDTDGQVLRSTDLLARGPVVVTAYRGTW